MPDNTEEAADEVSAYQNSLTGNWRKEAETLASLSPAVMCKVENMPNEVNDLAKETSSQNVKDVTWFFLVYSKT